ncbi:HEAT repeat domain-containing protein [Gloeothece verrucosa]|uniref:PBS lyase HEAT domain protein repeat-containing protein n=1 Tax=Gloeothece verrucosa (strain PCC 7822) TaxID=497965 RepID=E0U5W3_GLOV7|nr:HEAT repeat domain-containing protein [Gloeothece verrucosa]ADN15954.1 PBS lyase HEAT domain protein repeat-containing protein [Gloeothece verrucosa PCC 7822]
MITHIERLSEEETDALLQTVNEQIVTESFDSHNHQLIAQMVESLGDSRGMVRLGFAEALGKVGLPAVPFLEEALANHPDAVVRRAAAKTLTLIASPSAVPHLIHAVLHDEDTVVKSSSVAALARTGAEAVPPLLEILASEEHPESTKGHAAWALAFIGSQAKEIWYKEIHSESPVVRAAVIGAIAKIAQETPEEKAFDILIKALSDGDETVRTEAAAALGNLAYEPAVPHLVESLAHLDGETRSSAALALMKIGSPTAIVPLQSALSVETEQKVQRVLELAISQLQKQSEVSRE